MGTRGVVGFISNGREFGLYNGYDSQPSSLGHAIAQEIVEDIAPNLEAVKERLANVRWTGDGEIGDDVSYETSLFNGIQTTNFNVEKRSWEEADEYWVHYPGLGDSWTYIANLDTQQMLVYMLETLMYRIPFDELLEVDWNLIEYECRKLYEEKHGPDMLAEKDIRRYEDYCLCIGGPIKVGKTKQEAETEGYNKEGTPKHWRSTAMNALRPEVNSMEDLKHQAHEQVAMMATLEDIEEN